MKKAMTLTYEVGENLYLNVTNRCPCACVFCIRRNDDGAYGSDPLWLAHEPDWEEMRHALAERELTKYPELVFCGYGEPTMRPEFICDLADELHALHPDIVLRLNTNGLAARFASGGKVAADRIIRSFDKFSISLNAGDATVYGEVTRPEGDPADAYETMLRFAADCKAAGKEVLLTVVDVINADEIAKAQQKAESLGLPLRVRSYIA